MLPDIDNLLKLQEADREIRRLQAEIAEFPKRVAVIEQKLAGTHARLDAAKAAVKGDEANRRKFETAIQDLQGKISKYRDQSLAVKTNDQYKALLHEIQFAEQEIRANEAGILDVMVNAEAREKDVKAAEAELKAQHAEIEKEKAVARETTAVDEKALAEWQAKRTTRLSGIDPDLLRHYERVSKFRGSGISEVRNQKCMGCQVKLRPQTYNEVRSSDKVIVCDSCQRILYFDPASESAVAEAAAEIKRKRAKPKVDSAQAWFYRPDYGEWGEVFFVFVNSAGTSSRRVYDMHTGRQEGDTLQREGEYRLAFPEDLPGVIRLNGNWPEEEIEEWAGELPMNILDALQRDLLAARAEAKASGHGHAAMVPSERPAAS